MKITDLLCLQGIDMNGEVANKEEAIDHLVDLMVGTGNISDKLAFKKGILAREAQSTTGIGEGIAIPHAQVAAVKKPGLAVMIVKDGVDYQSLDSQPARLFFMIAAPVDGGNIHLETLARLSGMLMDNDFKENLINASDAVEFLRLIDDKENEIVKVKEETDGTNYEVLAVTACPTGIAHTFMAAESLEAKAKEMNILFKVETNGATGPKNVLTAEEISKARCIIVAADKQVEMSRFDGRPVIITKVADGINKAEELLSQAINGNVEIYHHQGDKVVSSSANEGIWRKLYTQLTDALSKILPIIIGSGALISIASLAASYNLFGIKQIYDSIWLSNSYILGITVNGMIVALFAGFIGQAIASQQGFAVALAGGAAMLLNYMYLQNMPSPGILGAIIAGFIGGYVVILLQKICRKLPECLDGIKPTVIYPIFGVMITGVLSYLISPYVGSLNQTISVFIGSMDIVYKLILGVIVGGMMSVDMGGPVNKIAYLFGIAQIVEGNFDVMAAVMAGGMVPPLAIAISTTFFRNKFTLTERKLGCQNYLKGLMFISEGTIPFVQKDPRLVTLACIVASAVAGGFSMLYNCGIRIPHGGIFVLPLIAHPFRYIVALLAGSLCGAVIYGFFKEIGEE